jgi:NTE family protein
MKTTRSITILCLTITTFFTAYPGSTLRAQGKADDPEVGLVLAGGGALGLAHVGVLEYLEELDIPIDRIGGTSMGGIVSGLYALGYDAQSLKEVALEFDWDYLLSNDFDRRKAPLATKNYSERYLLSLSRAKNQIGFTNAFIDGINIYQAFQRLTYPINKNMNFEELSIPFYCVAVDLKRGREVIQDTGYLPDALLSTMTIPAVFNPIEKDSFLLVDGGVLNNFPVKEMRRRGADLVIGVELITAKEEKEYPGPFEVLGRTYEIVTEEARKQYEGDCDICIEVHLQDYSVADFNKADSLIAIGRRAAEQYRDELLSLSGRAGASSRSRPIQLSAVRNPNIALKRIDISGNQYVPDRFILNTLKLKPPRSYSLEELQLAIEKLQASRQFSGIFYSFIQDDDGQTSLQIEVKEKDRATLHIGGNYNSDFGLSLLLHPQFKNWRGFGNEFDVELRVSRNPYLKFRFMSNSNGVFSPFAALKFEGEDYYVYDTDTDYEDLQNNKIEAKVGVQWNPSLNFAMGGGVEWQLYGFTDKAQQLIFESLNNQLYNYFLYAEADLLDQVHFPTKGFELKVSAKKITDDFSDFQDRDAPLWLTADYKHFLPISSKLVFSVAGQLGYSSDFIDLQYLFYQGGLYNYMRNNSMIQAGKPLMRRNSRNIFAFQSTLRWDLGAAHHITGGFSNSTLSMQFEDLFNKKFDQGLLLGYGYESIIGPLEIYLSSSTEAFEPWLFFRAGFKF